MRAAGWVTGRQLWLTTPPPPPIAGGVTPQLKAALHQLFSASPSAVPCLHTEMYLESHRFCLAVPPRRQAMPEAAL